MRRLLCVAVIVLCAALPTTSYAQQPAPAPGSGGLTGGQIVALAIVTAAVAAVAWYAVAGTAAATAGEAALGMSALEGAELATMGSAGELASVCGSPACAARMRMAGRGVAAEAAGAGDGIGMMRPVRSVGAAVAR